MYITMAEIVQNLKCNVKNTYEFPALEYIQERHYNIVGQLRLF